MQRALPLAVFGTLAIAVAANGKGPLGRPDAAIFDFLVGHWRSWPLNTALRISIHAGDARAVVAAAALAACLLALARRLAAAALALASVGVGAVVPLMKLVVARPAPPAAAGALSFPSGHAALTIAFAAALVSLAPSRARPAIAAAGAVFVAAVGCAVVTAQGHWPSDVVAGWALGLAWVGGLRSARSRATCPRWMQFEGRKRGEGASGLNCGLRLKVSRILGKSPAPREQSPINKGEAPRQATSPSVRSQPVSDVFPGK